MQPLQVTNTVGITCYTILEQPLIWLSDMMYNYDKRKNYGTDEIRKEVL